MNNGSAILHDLVRRSALVCPNMRLQWIAVRHEVPRPEIGFVLRRVAFGKRLSQSRGIGGGLANRWYSTLKAPSPRGTAESSASEHINDAWEMTRAIWFFGAHFWPPQSC